LFLTFNQTIVIPNVKTIASKIMTASYTGSNPLQHNFKFTAGSSQEKVTTPAVNPI